MPRCRDSIHFQFFYTVREILNRKLYLYFTKYIKTWWEVCEFFEDTGNRWLFVHYILSYFV